MKSPLDRPLVITSSSSSWKAGSGRRKHYHFSALKRNNGLPLILTAGIATTAFVSVVVVILLATSPRNRTREPVQIAFIGNSFQFVNDLPRVMESISPFTIHQDSCLHGSLSLITLLRKGNGMKNRWKTRKAWNAALGLYDFGACTVSQLLLGYDPYLENRQYQKFYTLDGKNPCFQDQQDNAQDNDDDAIVNDDDDSYSYSDQQVDDETEAYLEFTLRTKNTSDWDFVVLNDQSLRPAIPRKRWKSAVALNTSWIPLLTGNSSSRERTTTPILISTHGYWRPDVNMTDMGIIDVPHFTAKLQKGYELYRDVLHSHGIPAKIAPVGLAYLTVWEENPGLWQAFFGPDYYHPSPLGTYLQVCVVHATIFGRLPPVANSDQMVQDYFAKSRSMHLYNAQLQVPTQDQALYLRWITKRVVFQNYRPKSFLSIWERVLEDENE